MPVLLRKPAACTTNFEFDLSLAISIHPQIIEKEGKKEFVVLPYHEFLWLPETLEDYEDLRTLRLEKAEALVEPTRTLNAVLGDIEE